MENINAYDEERAGNPPLAEVAQTCSLKLAKKLLEKGADPNLSGWGRQNAIDLAKKRKKPEGMAVYELLKKYEK